MANHLYFCQNFMNRDGSYTVHGFAKEKHNEPLTTTTNRKGRMQEKLAT